MSSLNLPFQTTTSFLFVTTSQIDKRLFSGDRKIGTPKGGLLSTLLFNIYLMKFPSLLLISFGASLNVLNDKILQYLDNILEFLKEKVQ